MKTLGDKIRYFRNLKQWSQFDMADRLDISLPAYSKIERNVTDPSYSRLIQISKTFGITLIELLSLSDKPSEQGNLQKLLAEKEKEITKLQAKLIACMEKRK